MPNKYYIRHVKYESGYVRWRVNYDTQLDGHWVHAFLGEYDTWQEAAGVVSIELQGASYPYHTEHYREVDRPGSTSTEEVSRYTEDFYLYGREACS